MPNISLCGAQKTFLSQESSYIKKIVDYKLLKLTITSKMSLLVTIKENVEYHLKRIEIKRGGAIE